MGYHDHRGHVASEEVKETKEDIEKAIVIVDSIIEKLDIEKIKAAAKEAIMFLNDEDIFLRMQFCEEDSFVCLDEESHKEYRIFYTDIDSERGTFYKLERIPF